MRDLSGESVNQYDLIEKIGQGGQAAVYKAFDNERERIVAIKVMDEEALRDASAVKRFQMEATIAFFLRHPYVVTLYDYWRDDRGAWMVMRWFERGSLRDITQNQPLPLEETADMMDRIASALAAAHMIKVVHRDLKPDNILFDAQGESYLTDFGAAKRMEGPGMTQAGFIVGSPSYFSPEHIQDKPMTPRTDIYAMGIVLYETLTGKHPYQGLSTMEMLVSQLRDPMPSLTQLRPDLPSSVDKVIQKATQKDPDKRYFDIRDLASAFRRAIGLERVR